MPSASTSTAPLDLTDEKERFIHDRIHFMHTGRWPMYRMLALRRVGDMLYELAERSPRRARAESRCFTVVRWSISPPGLSWNDYPVLSDARAAFRAIP